MRRVAADSLVPLEGEVAPAASTMSVAGLFGATTASPRCRMMSGRSSIWTDTVAGVLRKLHRFKNRRGIGVTHLRYPVRKA